MLLDQKIEKNLTLCIPPRLEVPKTDLRVLLLAFDCHPTLPSLPIIAYNTCREIAKYTEATVVTRPYTEKFAVEGATTDVLNINAIKEPLDNLGELLRGGKDLGWTTKTALTYPTYLAFERMVWKKYKPIIKAGAFDLIARISPMSPTLPSPIAKWAPIPTVIGPVNGGLSFPNFTKGAARKEREWLMPLRKAARQLPYYKSSYRHAAAVLASFSHTRKDLPNGLDDKLINFPEIGFNSDLFFPPDRIPDTRQTQFVFVGRLSPNKRADIAIRAFADSPQLQRHHLTIIGEGPERESLQELINQHHLNHCVDLVGAQDQRTIGKVLRRSHVFVFPSVRELGAGAVIEAMACGLPVIAIDFGATADLINETRGIKISVSDEATMQRDYQRAMEQMADANDKLPFMRQQVISFAEEYSWDHKVANMLEVFKWVAGKRENKPECYTF